jgi:hypothetical protein
VAVVALEAAQLGQGRRTLKTGFTGPQCLPLLAEVDGLALGWPSSKGQLILIQNYTKQVLNLVME